MSAATTGTGLRRATGGLFVVGAVAFAAAATVLSPKFDWPDILREPASVVLPAFVAGGTTLCPLPVGADEPMHGTLMAHSQEASGHE